MIARAICTAIVLLLAFYTFWGNALDAGHIFNPFGILGLLLAYRAYPSASGGSISCGGDCGSVLRTNIEHMFARLV